MRRSLKGLLLLALSVAMVLSGCGSKQQAGEALVAKIGEHEVTRAEFEDRIRLLELMYNQDFNGSNEEKNALLEGFVNEKLVVIDAYANGVEADEAVLEDDVTRFEVNMVATYGSPDAFAEAKQDRQVTDELIRQAFRDAQVLDNYLAERVENITLSDTEIELYYEENKNVLYTAHDDQIRASHILVDDEAKAKELHAELKGGADFAELAMANSKDTTAVRGGDLGWFGKGQMVAPFEEAAFALENIGDISEPVQSQFGYHIIKLTGKQPAGVFTFENIKDQVAADALLAKQSATYQVLMEQLQNTYKPEIFKY